MELSEKRKLAQKASADSRRSNIQNRMADRLDLILKSTTDNEIKNANFKEKMVAAGILYDKLYRDNKMLPNTAVQINIHTMGQDPTKVEPLMIDVTPNKEK